MLQRLVLFLFVLISVSSNAQPTEVRWLNNINPDVPSSSSFQKNISATVYPASLAYPLGLAVVGILSKNKTQQQQGFDVLKALIVNTAITQALKYSINRDRPYVKYPNLIFSLDKENDPSFPSGHTSTAFNIATMAMLNHNKWYVTAPAFTWAGMVGYSRMYLGNHYPSDVAAGAAIGIGSAYLSKWLNKKLFKNK